jgi:hypothetical protein
MHDLMRFWVVFVGFVARGTDARTPGLNHWPFALLITSRA